MSCLLGTGHLLTRITRFAVVKTRINVFKLFTTTSYRLEFKTTDSSFIADTDDDTATSEQINKLIATTFQPETGGRHVFVIQPFIKWGPKKKRDTTPQLQLEESVSLINTLKDWTVRGKEIVSLYTFDKYTFFGTGKLDELRDKIQFSQCVTALFISVNMLSPAQHEYLESFFSLPVYDRYLIVMQIFREHAISKEAKLQIALAELPYIYSRMSHLRSASLSRIGDSATRISGTTIFSPPETRKLILHKYESKLKQSLEKLRLHREHSRKRRRTLEHPVVAVVGYTNAGKTSLIKALTGSQSLTPQNYLFATLDVTFHVGILPCNLKVFYIDTLGFISDIPTHLIEPFKVTLTDAMNADLIIHVQDVSHPDWLFQRDRVNETLETLNIDRNLLGHVIPVANKSDLLPENHDKTISDNTVVISCANGRGMDTLKLRLQDELINVTGRTHLIIRAKTGGDEFQWLNSEAAVADTMMDPKNCNYSLLSVIITPLMLDKFKRTFFNQSK